MNRRDFFRLLGKGALAAGAGLSGTARTDEPPAPKPEPKVATLTWDKAMLWTIAPRTLPEAVSVSFTLMPDGAIDDYTVTEC